MRDDKLESGAGGKTRGRGAGRPFKKGRSGNPAGRPVGHRATGAPGDRLPGSDQPTRAVILNEAYRLVTIGEGDEAEEMPTHVAVFRALTKAALKGSQIAQRRWTAMVRQAEMEQTRDQVGIFHAMEKPSHYGRGAASYDDDIIFDPFSREVIVRAMGEEGE